VRRFISPSACSFETNSTFSTPGVSSRRMRTLLICAGVTSPTLGQVVSVQRKTFVRSLSAAWSDQDSTHVPSAMKRPSRNIPMSTVIVAATVVERLAVSERIDSAKTMRNRLTRFRTPRGARHG
jgi:hypothetical protein